MSEHIWKPGDVANGHVLTVHGWELLPFKDPTWWVPWVVGPLGVCWFVFCVFWIWVLN